MSSSSSMSSPGSSRDALCGLAGATCGLVDAACVRVNTTTGCLDTIVGRIVSIIGRTDEIAGRIDAGFSRAMALRWAAWILGRAMDAPSRLVVGLDGSFAVCLRMVGFTIATTLVTASSGLFGDFGSTHGDVAASALSVARRLSATVNSISPWSIC